MTTDAIDGLVELSRHYGGDPRFTLGGGGNSSVKVDGVLHVKPSGTSLADLTGEALIALEVEPMLALLDAPAGVDADGGSELVLETARRARISPHDDRRPSVESLFHALLSERYVLHTHPVLVNALACASDGPALTSELFAERVAWVPYTNPGLPLALAIREARRQFGSPPPAIILQNHGLIVAGDEPATIVETSDAIVRTLEEHLAVRPPVAWGASPTLDEAGRLEALRTLGPVLRALLATGDRLKIVSFDGTERALQSGTELGRRFIEAGPLTPDQIVYAGSFPLVVELAEDDADSLIGRLQSGLAERATAGAEPPAVVVVPGLGVFGVGESHAEAETARRAHLDAVAVAEGSHRLGSVRALAPDERVFIERWEAEAYRRSVASGSPVAGRARGLVAVVTGAAQGFGLAIAADLVQQGAHVVLADVNLASAEARAAELVDRSGPGRAIAMALDVTDDGSVSRCFDAVVARYGGLDLVVSNAGILRAGSVTAQPVDEFDAVTRVNYRGYFLAVRRAAPILALQHRARQEYWSDIVEINSKSGLAGSSRNSAYAGSKFGGIGLTQSFALELVGDGIKVNAICPGNYLDGPLWSDPEKGLFVQYLREGKVPGATTIEDVRAFYEAKVPMGRGCTPADVLEALYYVIAQRYETGQAIPVTGGQVMLS